VDERYSASPECLEHYGHLSADNLARGDGDFIHQLAVEAYAAQHVGARTWPITLAFALAGLYLTFEHDYSGRQVQAAHGRMAARSTLWPRFTPPVQIGAWTIAEVTNVEPGEECDRALRRWGRSVWDVWAGEHACVESLVEQALR